MRNKERTIPEEAADKINDAVEDLTLKVAGTAVERNAERVAAKVNAQAS
jgi:sulfur carrier protein ThiS